MVKTQSTSGYDIACRFMDRYAVHMLVFKDTDHRGKGRFSLEYWYSLTGRATLSGY